jgi:hypothetical protein
LKKVHLLALLLLLFSCTNNKIKEEQTAVVKDTTVVKADPKQQLIGEWREHWGIGRETNVKSTDLFKIAIAEDGKLLITCLNKKRFAIDQVLFDGKELSFRKQNKSYPLGKFFVYYRLTLNDNYAWMAGPVKNNKKQSDYVKWEKTGISN